MKKICTMLAALMMFGGLAVSTARADDVVVVEKPTSTYARSHFYLGAEAVGTFILGQTGPGAFLSHGGGFAVFIGGRLGRWSALELGWQPTFHANSATIFSHPIDTLGLQAITLDLKIFPIHGPIQPYVTAGAGAYLLGDPFVAFSAGPGFQAGAGVDFWLLPILSLGLKAQYRGAQIYHYNSSNDDTYINMITASGNLTIHL